MAKQVINIGTTANDGTGDPLRSAFDKVNDNFTELYTDDAGDVGSITATAPIVRDSATGAVTVNWSAATNFVMGSSLTGAIEFDFTDFKTGQVLTIHNLTGSQTITLDSNATTSETFNKLGAKDYDGSATNALMIECISDSANAVFNYSVLTYVSDTTPS